MAKKRTESYGKFRWLGKDPAYDWHKVEKLFLSGATASEVEKQTGLNTNHYYWWKMRFGMPIRRRLEKLKKD